jgi:hypothetical protein
MVWRSTSNPRSSLNQRQQLSLIGLFILQQPAYFEEAELCSVLPVGAMRLLVVELGFELRKTMTFLHEVVLLALAREIEPAVHDERRDRVQFAGVQERPVTAADVDDGSRHPAEIDAVHHLPADDARAVMDRCAVGVRRYRRPVPFEHSGLCFAIRANPFEIGGADPDSVTRRALEDREVAEQDLRQLTAATRTHLR